MSEPLRPKHELFAQALARGETQRKAYELAGYRFNDLNSLDSNASRLTSNDKVNLRIQSLQQEAAMATVITLQGQLDKLERLLLQAEQLKQVAAAVSAVDKQSELAGLKVNRSEVKRVDEFAAMTDAELDAYLASRSDQGQH